MLALYAMPAQAGFPDWLIGNKTENKLVEGCEEVLRERLPSPRSYESVEISEPVRQVASLDEYMGWYLPDVKAELGAT